MSDRVILPLAGVGTLVLSREEYEAGLAAGRELSAAPTPSSAATDEPLLDADQLAGLLNIPVSWLEQKAREGVIPSLEFGRWRRFRRSEVESTVRATRERA